MFYISNYLTKHFICCMFSTKEWAEIEQPKILLSDQHGQYWKVDHNINSSLRNLHWSNLDQPIEKYCILYQMDSNGALLILQIMFIVEIWTQPNQYVIIYKTDQRHARLEYYLVARGRLGHIGLCSVQTIKDTAHSVSSESFQSPILTS